MSSLLGIAAALGLVLVLLGFALRALRQISNGALGGRGRLPLEVVQRVAVGPRQGIALVRVGQRVIAVSVGDGGVRPVLELEGADRDALLAPAEATLPSMPRLAAVPAFAALLQAARRSVAVLALLALAGVARPALAAAQELPRPAAPAAVRSPTVPGVARPVPREVRAATVREPQAQSVEQLDTKLPQIAPQIDLRMGDQANGGLRLSGTVGVIVMMGLLTLLPTLLLMMTSFTRILIVLHFLRQAIGTQSAPPAHLISALALLLTGFVMAPTLSEVNQTALQPWMSGQMEQGEMLTTGVRPFRDFMLAQTRDSDLSTFLELSPAAVEIRTPDDIPLVVLLSAFATSELRTAFQIGFALFLPFIVIDVIVASVLMSMGMFMLPPTMIALPFKLLLFVLVDGWSLIVQGLVASFN